MVSGVEETKMKFGIKGMSLMWIGSGIACQILSLFLEPVSDRYLYMGMAFVGVGAFGMIMDMRDEKKKQQNSTTSL